VACIKTGSCASTRAAGCRVLLVEVAGLRLGLGLGFRLGLGLGVRLRLRLGLGLGVKSEGRVQVRDACVSKWVVALRRTDNTHMGVGDEGVRRPLDRHSGGGNSGNNGPRGDGDCMFAKTAKKRPRFVDVCLTEIEGAREDRHQHNRSP
jgi:hypothetical protein